MTPRGIICYGDMYSSNPEVPTNHSLLIKIYTSYMSRPTRRPRSKTRYNNRRITLPDSAEEAEYKKNSRKTRKDYRKQIEDYDNKSRQVEFLAKDIIENIFSHDKASWPRKDEFLDVFRNQADGKTQEEGDALTGMDEDYLIEWARETRKRRKEELDAARREERIRISNQNRKKEEEERQKKLCRDLGICSVAVATAAAAAAVGAPPLAAAAAAAVVAAKYRGLIGGRTRRKRKRQRKSKSKTRRKKEKKRKTRRLRRKSR
jgi:hypothetical protein